jgi:1-acyl-sn-glycerol-3-phosphate acyltransferase
VRGSLDTLRGVLALLGVALLFGGLGLYQRLVLWPLVALRPGRRHEWVGRYMRFVAERVLGLARFAGARFELRGRIATDVPVLIVMNHQSLIDIPVATLMTGPRAPRFVTRYVYERFVPLVSVLLRLSDAVIVNPDRRAREAVRRLSRTAETLESGLLIFPEGVRSSDGSLARFQGAGLRALLRARRLPVYLIVIDGVWQCRTLLDFARRAQQVRARAVVAGPLTPPRDASELPAFVRHLEAETRDQLARLREEGQDG